jgi:hypothetical protein
MAWSWIATGPGASALHLPGKRILVPANYRLMPRSNRSDDGEDGKPKGDPFSFALLSDDGGATWIQSEAIPGGDETQAALAPNGSVVMNMRTFFPERRFSWSMDGGVTWSPPVSAPFPHPVTPCGGSMVRVPAEPILLFTLPRPDKENLGPSRGVGYEGFGSKSNRKDLALYTSGDSGATWQLTTQITIGKAAYSSLVTLSSTEYMLLFEVGRVGGSEYPWGGLKLKHLALQFDNQPPSQGKKKS